MDDTKQNQQPDTETPVVDTEEVTVIEADAEPVLEDADVTSAEELGSTPEADAYNQPENKAETVIRLDSLIKRYISSLNKLKEEMRSHKAMLNDAVVNDAAYSEQDAKAKEAIRIRNAAKQQVMKQDSVALIQDKVMEVKEELKDMQEALGDYLQEYVRLTGATEIETDEGEIHSIINLVRLVKKGNANSKHR